ncbi:MAG: hypothetical protein Ta2D_09020 [Rickettsiales bacterium]|nr:MAG: hypothetical protein Ta2D_09020 [Rickettsiales bacterium]
MLNLTQFKINRICKSCDTYKRCGKKNTFYINLKNKNCNKKCIKNKNNIYSGEKIREKIDSNLNDCDVVSLNDGKVDFIECINIVLELLDIKKENNKYSYEIKKKYKKNDVLYPPYKELNNKYTSMIKLLQIDNKDVNKFILVLNDIHRDIVEGIDAIIENIISTLNAEKYENDLDIDLQKILKIYNCEKFNDY